MTTPTAIKHPSWCDPSRCTAPAEQPTDRQAGDWPNTAHRSAAIRLPADPIGVPAADPTDAFLYQYVAPWPTETYFHLALNNGRLLRLPLETAAEALAHLVDLIRPAIAANARTYPSLPIPGARVFPELVDAARAAAGAESCRADVAVWNAVHAAAVYHPGGPPTLIRVTPHKGAPVVGHVVGISNHGFELGDHHGRFAWPDVAAVTPIDTHEGTTP